MSEEINTTENPGKNQNIIGFVLSLVSIVLGAYIMAFLYSAGGRGAAALTFVIPIAAIVFSVMGMKASKAAGHKAGMGVAGMVIGIVAIVILLLVFLTFNVVDSALEGGIESLENMENVEELREAMENLQESADH